MNSFMVFADRDRQACELRSAAQYLSLLADIIQVENGRIDNDNCQTHNRNLTNMQDDLVDDILSNT